MKKEMSKTSQPGPLNYFKQSPVRGQLEPYDPRVNKGWPGRFLQCTETPNQLKVGPLPVINSEISAQFSDYL